MARKYVENDEPVQRQSERSADRAARAGMSDYNPGSAFSEGHEPMVGRNEFAGLPTEKVMRSYPKSTRLTRNERLDDTMSEIDDVDGRAQGKRSKYISNQH